MPWDRTTGVLGPQGSGKTLDLLVPALLGAPGGALVTLTKVEDLLLTITARSAGGRPCVVFDPFGSAVGLPELVWDPVAGCADPWVAERRARAFTAGTLPTGTAASDHGGDAARFYAAEATKVIQAYLHAAALIGGDVGRGAGVGGRPRRKATRAASAGRDSATRVSHVAASSLRASSTRPSHHSASA